MKNRTVLRVSFMVIVMMSAAVLVVTAASPAGIGSTFIGRVRDIDYGPSVTQIIASGTGTADELIATVSNNRLQSVLQAALISGRTVEIVHQSKNIKTARLIPSPTICAAKGCIEELKCSAGSCDAVISGYKGRVYTTSERA